VLHKVLLRLFSGLVAARKFYCLLVAARKKKKQNKAILDYFIYVQTVALYTHKKKKREKQDYPNKGTNKFTFNEDQQKLQR
jgi:hypothetical protein